MKNPNVINIDISDELEIAKLRPDYGTPRVGYRQDAADEMLAKILGTPNTEEIYEITGTKYYVSVNGDDNNDGTSPESPIKTLEKIHALDLKEGDAVLFKRGDTFRFCDTVNAADGVTYGSYGEGPKPRIFGSPENYAENDSWEEVKPNIWAIDFAYPHAGGCVLDHSKIIGVQKDADRFDGMTENGDYFHDDEANKFYLYSDGKPSDRWHDIEIMPNFSIFLLRDSHHVTVDNLCMKYTCSFGIHAPDIKNNINITNCEFGFTGGRFNGGKTVRFGNAIEFWAGFPGMHMYDVKVENNWFYQTYDSAVTWQCHMYDTIYENFSFSRNLFEYNNADIEFWGLTGCEVINYQMDENIMRFTSMGWGTRKNDGGIRGIEGCLLSTTGYQERLLFIDKITFINNIIDCPARQIIHWNTHPSDKKRMIIKGNEVHVKTSYRTLEPLLQGLQDNLRKEERNQFIAYNKEEFFKLYEEKFEKNAKLFWHEE